MRSNRRSMAATKLAKITVIGLFSLNVSIASAAVPNDLQEMNAQWEHVFGAKNLVAAKNYYDESSLVAGFPYDAKKGLKSAETIGNMFQNGPFKLDKFNVEVVPVGFDANANTALLLKSWKVSHSGGAFSGLAIEVLEKKEAGWKRIIDISAGGITNIAGFSEVTAEKNKLFKAIDVTGSVISQLKAAQQNDELNKQVKAAIATGVYDNLTSVSNAQNGLLIAKVEVAGKEYISFNALVKQAEKWQVKVQFFSAN